MLKWSPLRLAVSALCFFAFLSSTWAQDAATAAEPTPAVTPAAEPEKPGLLLSGFVDAYYQHSFNKSTFPTSFTPNNNSFSLGMANLVLTKEGKVGFVADIAVGPRAEAANGYAGTALSFIKQLYVKYAATDKLTFTLGNFSTFFCYEVIDSKSNYHYTTSYIFSYGPFFHTGIKADYALSEHLSVMLGVFNDTDTKIDVVGGKHIGGQLSYKRDNFSLYFDGIGGRITDPSETSTETMGYHFDVYSNIKASDRLGLGFNVSRKSQKAVDQEGQSWLGTALYTTYALSDAFSLGVRGEFIRDADGMMLGKVDNNIAALTFSSHINLGSLTVIPELRFDSTKQEDTYTSLSGDALKAMSGLLMAVVYSF